MIHVTKVINATFGVMWPAGISHTVPSLNYVEAIEQSIKLLIESGNEAAIAEIVGVSIESIRDSFTTVSVAAAYRALPPSLKAIAERAIRKTAADVAIERLETLDHEEFEAWRNPHGLYGQTIPTTSHQG